MNFETIRAYGGWDELHVVVEQWHLKQESEYKMGKVGRRSSAKSLIVLFLLQSWQSFDQHKFEDPIQMVGSKLYCLLLWKFLLKTSLAWTHLHLHPIFGDRGGYEWLVCLMTPHPAISSFQALFPCVFLELRFQREDITWELHIVSYSPVPNINMFQVNQEVIKTYPIETTLKWLLSLVFLFWAPLMALRC